MRASDDTGSDDRRETAPSTVDALSTVSRYDLVLAVIPFAFLGAVLLETLLAVPPRSAVVVAAVVAVVALVDALFLNPPRNAGFG